MLFTTSTAPVATPSPTAPASTDEQQATAQTAPSSNPILVRQEPLKLVIPKGVAVIGCGGVGSWIAYFLALAGVDNLWLFDPDIVSESNLNRLPLPQSAIGKSKSQSLADFITSQRPSATITAMSAFSEQIADLCHLSDEVSWLVCSTDTLATRQMSHNYAVTHGRCYIEAAAEGEYGSIASAPAEWATADDAKPGYASVPVWVGPATFAASMAAAYILHDHYPERDLVTRLGWSGHSIDYTRICPPPCTLNEILTYPRQFQWRQIPVRTPTRPDAPEVNALVGDDEDGEEVA
jgi:hypothetical protein